MVKILFYMDTLSGGGAEKVLCNLVNHMDQTKYDITVQTFEACGPQKYLVKGIHYKAVNRSRIKAGRKLFSYWFRLCAELKLAYPLYIRDDYDIEVAYLECGPTKILAGSTNQKALKLAWVHCDLAKKEGMAAQAEKLKAYYRAYDKVICVSENVKDSFVRMFGDTPEAVVLHNVNDETRILEKAHAFLPERSNAPTFAAIGRLSYEKGNDRLLEACRLLKANGYDIRLWLVGEGPEREKLEKMIREFHLEQHVKLWGFQDNPYPYMATADFLVVPSRFEGLSTVVTEALILGRPVVTTPCSGMRELLGDSEYGLITGDSVEGIYSGIRRMLDEPRLREHYARAAAQRGKDFSKDAILPQTEHFFQDELEKKRKKQ